jgi:hypothetical protein
MPTAPKFDGEYIATELENMSRGPFRRVLAKLLENAPTSEAIAAQAERNPDRWAQTTALIARLGGYNERLEVEGTLNLKIQTLSDSELALELEKLQRTLDNESRLHRAQAIEDTEVS